MTLLIIQFVKYPFGRMGAGGALMSVYIRETDGNLLENSNYSNG